MPPRRHIPALALLGLSLTECDRDDAPTIVGQWQLVEIDGEVYPYASDYDGSNTLYGFELTVDDELAGEFSIYAEWEDEGYLHGRTERSFAAVVDDSAAPEHTIEIPYDPFGGYYYFRRGPADDDDALTARDAPLPIKRLTVPTVPDHAPAEFVLHCTLAGDDLTCDRDGDDEPRHLVFVRKRPEPD